MDQSDADFVGDKMNGWLSIRRDYSGSDPPGKVVESGDDVRSCAKYEPIAAGGTNPSVRPWIKAAALSQQLGCTDRAILNEVVIALRSVEVPLSPRYNAVLLAFFYRQCLACAC